MKFAREFRDALEKEGYPKHWVDSAVPYGQLKKCLKRVQKELEDLGLAPETLAEITGWTEQEPRPTGFSGSRSSGSRLEYGFDCGSKVHPKLTLFVQLDDGVVVDATLSPTTRGYLSRLVLDHNGRRPSHVSSTSDNGRDFDGVKDPQNNVPGFQRIEVHLNFDSEFFDTLHRDVNTLDKLQAREKDSISTDIEALSTDLRALARPPTKFHKSDMNRWRELFDIYIQAGIFFSTHELDHGRRDSTKATQQLQWFQSEVMKRGIVQNFKLPQSQRALSQFLKINITLLQTLKFQEINQKAISKILKKFDKRTYLGARQSFPRLIESDSIMTDSMARAVCSQMSQDLVKIVPQLEDYKCPICLGIVWRPIRMRCKHMLCIECALELQRSRKRRCPLCRDDVIMEADADSIDHDLEAFLEKYFPKEVLEKRIQVETQRGKEMFGPSYTHPSESACQVM